MFTLISNFIERTTAWFLLLLLMITLLVVILRYFFNLGSIALQELMIVCYAVVFLLGFQVCLRHDKHVRVDIFYQKMTVQMRNWVNALGLLVFLMPFSIFLFVKGNDFFFNAFNQQEASSEPGGLSYWFLFKALIPVSAFLLLFQTIFDFISIAKRLIFKAN